MAVSFFGGPDGHATRVWSAGKFVTDQEDKEKLRARIRELESLCTDVLVAGVDLGLPQNLLNQLWAAVGNGEMPLAYHVDLPPAPPRPIERPKEAARVSTLTPSADPKTASPPRREPMEIPDIPLSTNPLTSGGDESRPKPPQADFKPLSVKKTVAVVDDDPMMLDVLARILQRENFELIMAASGPEIMDKLNAQTGEVDLLVTDFSMPGMEGRELAERVRERFPAVKVLYQTGFSDRLFEDRAELEDGAAFVEKPFTARGLREAARLVLFGSINP
jgi:CheY-like chemotaxis protein